MFKWILTSLLALLITPKIVFAADFYLHFANCKTTVSYLVLSNESLKTVEGDGSLTSCTRTSQSLRCDIDFLGGSKGERKSVVYKIDLELPPLLTFSDEMMGDYYVIDMSQHAASLITRMVNAKFAGAKVCHGMYMTDSERKEFDKLQRR